MIRQAQVEDYEAIKEMKSSLGIDRSQLDKREYSVSLQKKGFLLFPYLEKSQFEDYLRKLFLVYEDKNNVIGYIVVDSEQELEMKKGSNNLVWFRKDIEPIYFSHPHANISVIAVSPVSQYKGVGTCLLQEVAKRITQGGEIPYLFSFVVSSPITNFPSMLFHEKMGFDRIAFTYYTEIFGLKNYQSILYGKEL